MTTQERMPPGPSDEGNGDATPELDSDLAALFARERRSHSRLPGRQDRVWARLERSLKLGPQDPGDGGGGGGSAASTSAPPPPRSTPASKRYVSALAISACFAVGASLVWSVASGGGTAENVALPEPQPSLVIAEMSSPAALDAPAENAIEERAVTPVEALPSVRPPVKPLERVEAPRKLEPAVSCTICEERAVLEVARRGLRDKRGEVTLAAIEEHQSRFPAGQLAEERESLRVHALFAIGRAGEAEARKSEFETKFPRSPLLESVKRAGTR